MLSFVSRRSGRDPGGRDPDTMDDDGGMESLFSTFMNEVTSIKTTKMKKLEGNVGTPDEVVARITASTYDPKQGYGSAFQILGISPEASDSEITKQYRKLSVLIHPDKCKLEQASEAFQTLVKAYNDTKDPNYNDKYRGVLSQAKESVKKARKEENKARAKRGEDPFDMEGHDFDQAVLKECERMTTQSTEHATQANSVLEANMKRHEDQRKLAREQRKEVDAEKKKWEKTRDKRAAGWQIFMQNQESKKAKVSDILFQREERTDQQGKANVDWDDKKVLRSDVQAAAVGIDRSYMKKWH